MRSHEHGGHGAIVKTDERVHDLHGGLLLIIQRNLLVGDDPRAWDRAVEIVRMSRSEAGQGALRLRPRGGVP